MDRNAKTQAFADLHVKGKPLLLWNVWDAGSARAVAQAGAPALATGSWSVAAAQGYDDGEALPLATALASAAQIVAAAEVPVSIDFEGCYATEPEQIAQNVAMLLQTGAVGLNFEDRVVGGKGLHPVRAQAASIAAIREMAQRTGQAVFINARTDLFFAGLEGSASDMYDELMERAAAYAQAGADCLFVPGISELDLIGRICADSPLPVNVMRLGDKVDIADLAKAGVARISHGPGSHRAAMEMVHAAAARLYASEK